MIIKKIQNDVIKKYFFVFILALLVGIYFYQYKKFTNKPIDNEILVQYYKQGTIALKNNKNKEALEFFDKILELVPKSNFKDLYVNKGTALARLGKYQKAIDNYNLAIKLNANYEMVYLNKGISLLMLGRNLEAIENFDKVIEFNPNSYDAYNNKGAALGYLNKYQEAIDNYNKAIELNPKYFEPHKNKFCPLYNLKRYEEAVETCDKAIKLEPNHHDIQEVIDNRIKALNKIN
jgi:tetratricopeptide (TPR) repeat protein